MADGTLLQTSFLGGEWSPYAQGRMDDQRYRTGMNVCRNTVPVEEGSATRRPGTRLAAATRSGAPAVLRNFAFEKQHPYSLELTQNHLRFFSGPALLSASVSERVVTAVSGATPAVVTVTPLHDLVTGDQVYFRMDDPSAANASLNVLLGRELVVTVLTTSTFSIVDALTGEPINGTGVTVGATVLFMEKIVDVATPYLAADLQAITTVQDQAQLLLLHGSYKPNLLQSTSPEVGNTYAVFSFAPADFLDGPYLDPVKDGAVITASATSGTVTLTISGGTTRWVSTDVGRLVRLFYEPAAWATGTPYVAGNKIKYNGAYYIALKATTGEIPESNPQSWGVDTAGAAWTWAQITVYTSATVVSALIRGAALISTAPAIATWRLGMFSTTTGWPTCGVYHEDRLWLTGVVGNRIDGSKSNDLLNFAPTSPDGTVADDNACSYVFAATDVNKIFWMVTDNKGIVCGTQAGEWVVQASQQNDPLTPTSVQAHRYTDYGCADVQARRAGLAIAFVQRHGKKVQEYITTDSRGFAARNISVTGKHLTGKTTVVELAYVRELAPIVWARTSGGELIGCTYKRENPYASEPADFAGWHRHDLGSGHSVVSIQAGPSFGGDLDALSMVTKDAVTGYHYVDVMTDIFDATNDIGDAYFVDMGIGPAMYAYTPGVSLVLYGLWRLEGKTISAFVGGVDMGDFVVTLGKVTIPIDGAGSLLTTTWINSLASVTNFRGFGLKVPSTTVAAFPTLLGIADVTPSINQSGFTGQTNGFEAFDWDRRRVYMEKITTGGLRSINLDTWTQVAVTSALPTPPNSKPMTTTLDGNLLLYDLATNCATIYIYDPLTLSEKYRFGANSAGFASGATTIAIPASRVTVKAGDRNFLVNSSSLISEVATFDLDKLADNITPGIHWTNFASATANGDAAMVSRGLPKGNLACAYVVDRLNGANGSDGASSLPINIYRVLIARDGTTSMTLLGSLDMTALFGAANWRHFNNIGATIADETPGSEGILIQFEYATSPAWGAATNYVRLGETVTQGGHDWRNINIVGNLNQSPAVSPTFWTDMGVTWVGLNTGGDEQKLVKVKVSGGTLTVPWTQRIFGFGGLNRSEARVRHGRYGIMGVIQLAVGVKRVWNINTVTGATVTTDVNIFASNDGSYYNDQTGELYIVTSFSHDAAPPGGVISPIATGRSATWGAGTFAVFTNAAAPYLPPITPPIDGFLGIPVALGFTYTSQGQILRPIAPPEAGTAGPAMAVTRRTHQAGQLLHKTQGIKFGTVFSKLRPAEFKTAGNRATPLTTLFSGIYWTSLEDDYSFDSMFAWEVTRPYPATILTVGQFVKGEER